MGVGAAETGGRGGDEGRVCGRDGVGVLGRCGRTVCGGGSLVCSGDVGRSGRRTISHSMNACEPLHPHTALCDTLFAASAASAVAAVVVAWPWVQAEEAGRDAGRAALLASALRGQMGELQVRGAAEGSRPLPTHPLHSTEPPTCTAAQHLSCSATAHITPVVVVVPTNDDGSLNGELGFHEPFPRPPCVMLWLVLSCFML